jgi:EF-P beta-lysylation protein EpmB
MIPYWRQIQKKSFTRLSELCKFLKISEEPFLTHSSFPLLLPLRLAEKIEKGNLNDPILKQFLPDRKELIDLPGFTTDPVSELTFQKSGRLLGKYPSRTLLIPSSGCAMNCRYCFRRHYPYGEAPDFEQELERLDPSISELILSGGDPLSLDDASLSRLLTLIGSRPSIRRLRFHTRFPIGIPERITEELLLALDRFPGQVYFVIHANHPREFDSDIFAALKKIGRLGIPILQQGVLLKGINDDLTTLKTLYELLAEHAILPYYLLLLDPVAGASHYDVPLEEAKPLMERLRDELSGYAVPRLAKEIPGRSSKTLFA